MKRDRTDLEPWWQRGASWDDAAPWWFWPLAPAFVALCAWVSSLFPMGVA